MTLFFWKLIIICVDCCIISIYILLPAPLRVYADLFFEMSLEVITSKQERRTFSEIIRSPMLIINFILSMFFAGIALIIVTFAFISIFINSQLDPLDGYDLNLIIFEWTGHFPDTTLFM